MTFESQEELVINNMNIVRNIASKYYTEKIGLEYEDLVSYGVMGLIDASKKFDDSRGVKFSTFASIRVSSYIIDEIRKYSPVSRTYMSKIKEYNKSVDELQHKFFREPSMDEVAKYMNISKKEVLCIVVITLIITIQFYFILKHFHTANLIPSTISVTTSFFAASLTFRRSPFFALAYAANDVVLIVLWVMASRYDIRYSSVVVCFVAFLLNDIYGFLNWQRMKYRQQECVG